MKKTHKFKSVALPEPYYNMGRKLAEKENRTLSNYLQVLISKEYEKVKIIAILALLMFASCQKEQVAPLPQPEPDCYECKLINYELNAGGSYIYSWTSHYENCRGTDTNDTTIFWLDGMTHKYMKRVRTCELID